MLHRTEERRALQLGRYHLLLQILPAVGAVALENGLRPGRRWDQILAVALHVEDVQRDRVNIGRRQRAKSQPGRVGEELRDESGLLLGWKGAQRIHEVLRETRVVLLPALDPLVGDAGNRLRGADVREPHGQPVAALAFDA
jgi:hypothetical protein